MHQGVPHDSNNQWDEELPFIPTPAYQPPNIPSNTSPGSFDWNDPTSGVFPVGSPQWYAQQGSSAANTEALVEEATGKDIDQDWIDKYGAFLPTYDPTGERFAEGKYALAGEKYDLAGEAFGTAGKAFGLAKEGYQFELGDIFSQAGTGTMNLLASYAGGGKTMTGRKGRKRGAISKAVGRAAGQSRRKLGAAGLQYDIASQAYDTAGLTYAGADITRASSIYDLRSDFADKYSDAISDLSADEAFVDLEDLPGTTPSNTLVNTFEMPSEESTFMNPYGTTQPSTTTPYSQPLTLGPGEYEDV